MVNKLQITNSSSPIFDKPNINGNLETEGLFGEIFIIEKSAPNWYYGFLETDGYYGWIQSKFLGDCSETNYKIISSRSIILTKPDVKSKYILYVPMCSLIKVKKFVREWAEIQYKKQNILKVGYVPKSHISKINSRKYDWKNIALNLINIPYKWGGRDTISLDCSSLIQLICNTQNIFLPRNTNEQVLFLQKNFENLIVDPKLYKDIYKTKSFKKGSLVYWTGHVGILIENNIIMHANAFHNNVNIEDIQDMTNRLLDQDLKIKLICQLLK